MNEACERYLKDPEANAAHREACAACRDLFGALEAPVEGKAVVVDDLPLAPWEGASHRAWPLVVGGAAIVLALAALLFVIAGVSPLRGFGRAVLTSLPPLDIVTSVARAAGSAVKQVPASWQIATVIAFLVINTIFALLLRRAPKGVDAD